MDVNVLFFLTIMILLMGLLGVGIRHQRGLMFSFFGFMLGILTMVQLNTDGAIQGLATGAPTGIFPYFYFPLFFTILDAAVTAYEGLDIR